MNPTKDSAMYPKPEYDLQGWEIHALTCGNTHTVVAADGSTIAWGSGTGFGELGLGDGGAKSSAKPKKVREASAAFVTMHAFLICFRAVYFCLLLLASNVRSALFPLKVYRLIAFPGLWHAGGRP